MTGWPTQIHDNPSLLGIPLFHGIERGEHKPLHERSLVKRPCNAAKLDFFRQVRINLVWKGQRAPMCAKIKNGQSIRHVTDRPAEFKKVANNIIRIMLKEFTPLSDI